MSPPAFSRSTRATASSSFGLNFRIAKTCAISDAPPAFAGESLRLDEEFVLFAEAAELFRSMLSQVMRKDCTASSDRLDSEEKIAGIASLAVSRIWLVSSSSTKWISAGATIRSRAMSSNLYSMPSDDRQIGLSIRSVVVRLRNANPSQKRWPSDIVSRGRDRKLHMAFRQRVGGGVRSCMRLLIRAMYR